MQHIPHTRRARVRKHDEAKVCGRLVEMQLVLPRAVADEGVVVAAELADHVAEGEDGSEDELGVVRRGGQDGRGSGAVGRHPRLDVDALGWRIRRLALVAAGEAEGRTVAVEDVERIDNHVEQLVTRNTL